MATSSDLAVLIDYGQNREDAEATTSEKWDMGHHHSAVTLLPSQEQEHMLRVRKSDGVQRAKYPGSLSKQLREIEA